MKPRRSNQTNHALTLMEVLVVIVILFILILATILLPPRIHYPRVRPPACVNNLKQIGLAFQVWSGDNNGKLPMNVSVTNGGAMELAATGNVVAIFQVMSNELSTPKILVCPEDKAHRFATNFGPALTAKNISYFIGLDTDKANNQIFLSGDDNLQIDRAPLTSGISTLSTNSNIGWAPARHPIAGTHFWTPDQRRFYGNIGLMDGSARQVTTLELQQALQQTGLATNRLVLP